MAINPDEFGASFNDFMEQMRSRKKPEEAPFFVRKLRDHFGTEPSGLPIVSQSILPHDHPNLHSAIEDYLAAGNRSAEVLGVVGLNGFMGQGLADLVAPHSGFGSAANQGPVEYANRNSATRRRMPPPALRALRPWTQTRSGELTAIHFPNRRRKCRLHPRAVAPGRTLCRR